MLSRLSVRNLAVVESAEIRFSEGLNVITGETGAGKSVLMGALRLLQGCRADRSIIRTGAEEATVAAVYELSKTSAIDAVLQEADLPLCEEGVLLLRRTLRADGTGKVRINDCPATAATLRKLAPLLTDIHGPDDNLTLLDESFQLRLLTAYADALSEQNTYHHRWETLRKLHAQMQELVGQPGQREAEMTRLRETLADIAAVNPTENDGDALTEQHAQAANAEAILSAGNQLLAGLSDGDNPLTEQLIAHQRTLHELARVLPEAADWSAELSEIQVRLQELTASLAQRLSLIDAAPETLAYLETRLGQIQRLRRRYGPTLEDVLRHQKEAQAKLEAFADSDLAVERLKAEIAHASALLLEAGKVLRSKRQAACALLAQAITGELRDLGFLQAAFPITLAPLDEPSPTGLERVLFGFEPNPGEKVRPLADIASSGEIARVMLAIKVILARHDAISTLVFDEIDANIGGETGRKVGLKLRQLAQDAQILCITHQPQAAVYGQHHLRVSKSVSGGRTQALIEPLDADHRIAEIARMLGGEDFTPITRDHALEMLRQATACETETPLT